MSDEAIPVHRQKPGSATFCSPADKFGFGLPDDLNGPPQVRPRDSGIEERFIRSLCYVFPQLPDLTPRLHDRSYRLRSIDDSKVMAFEDPGFPCIATYRLLFYCPAQSCNAIVEIPEIARPSKQSAQDGFVHISRRSQKHPDIWGEKTI